MWRGQVVGTSPRHLGFGFQVHPPVWAAATRATPAPPPETTRRHGNAIAMRSSIGRREGLGPGGLGWKVTDSSIFPWKAGLFLRTRHMTHLAEDFERKNKIWISGKKIHQFAKWCKMLPHPGAFSLGLGSSKPKSFDPGPAKNQNDWFVVLYVISGNFSQFTNVNV